MFEDFSVVFSAIFPNKLRSAHSKDSRDIFNAENVLSLHAHLHCSRAAAIWLHFVCRSEQKTNKPNYTHAYYIHMCTFQCIHAFMHFVERRLLSSRIRREKSELTDFQSCNCDALGLMMLSLMKTFLWHLKLLCRHLIKSLITLF